MELELSLKLDQKDTSSKVKEAVKKKANAKYVPTWEEVWTTGYVSHTGTAKKSILQSKITDSDRTKLLEVKHAVETGEIGTHVEDLRKFSKSHAMNLYKVLTDSRKESYIKKMIVEKPANYHLIQHEIDFGMMLTKMKAEKYIGLDTETTGVVFDKDFIVGISLTLPSIDQHYYIPIRHTVSDLQLNDKFVLDQLKPFMEDDQLGKVLHNAKFDSHMFWFEKIDLKGILMDTMIAMHVLNENEESYALKKLATKYGSYFGFAEESHTYESLFGKGGFEATPLDIGHIYACKDTHLVVEFYKWIESFFKKQPQLGNAYHKIENPLLNVIIQMERNGSLIDLDFAKQYVTELEADLADLAQQITAYLGEDCEFGSNQQLKARLIQMDILEPDAKSVDKNALKYVSHKHEVIDLILEHRGLSKLHSTYIVPLPSLVRRSGRLHGQFNQHRTVTSRLSSDAPNLQNIPPKARKMFVAPAGKILVGIDLSQIEPRYLSHVSKDEDFRHPYLVGIDIYASLASKTFKVALEECLDGSSYRKMMKVGLLAVMYGISDFELAKSLKITVEEAVQFMQDFMDNYPDTDKWIKSIQDLVEEQEYVPILGGRKRRFPKFKQLAQAFKAVNKQIEQKIGHPVDNIWTEKKLKYAEKRAYWDLAAKYFKVLRQSVNAIIQGSCATILKYGMIKLHDHLKTKGPEWLMLLQVHDELIFEIPDTATPEEIQELSDIICSVVTLAVPLQSDIEIMKVWGQGIKFAQWVENRKVA